MGVPRRIALLRALGRSLGAGAPPPAGLEATALVEMAAEHGLTPALHLAWRDVATAIPPDVAERLRVEHRQNLARAIRLKAQLGSIAAALAGREIEVMALKGAAHLAAETLPDPGARMMADIDLLVLPAQVEDAARALGDAGYCRRPLPWGLEHHDIVFERPGGAAVVELHRAIGTSPLARALPEGDLFERGRRVLVAGSPILVPSLEDGFVHHVLHAEVQDRNLDFFGVPLRQLHTTVLLADGWRGGLEGDRVARRFEAAGQRPALERHLGLVRRIFGTSVLGELGTSRPTRARIALSTFSFALGWPTDVARNVSWSLDPAYLDARYGPVDSRRAFARRSVHHLLQVARRDDLIRAATAPRR